MTGKYYVPVLAAVVMAMLLAGCGIKKKNENITAGIEQIKALEYDAALACFEAAREAGEDQRQLFRAEGLAYMGKTMYTEAAQAFESALASSNGRVDSMDIDINYYLATAYYKQGQPEEAIAIYDAITNYKGDERDAYYLRGVLYTEKENLEQAAADFDKTMELDNTDYDRLIEIYGVLDANGYREKGQEYLRTAMDAGTKGMTNFEKGRICYYLGDYENAKTYLEKARKESGYEAVLFLGRTYETLGDQNYAISVYNTFLDNGGANPQVLNQLGLCKMNIGDYEGALTAFQTAMTAEDSSMLQALKMNEIIAYEELGEFRKAAVLMDSYLKSYPDDQDAQREYIFLQSR